MIENKVKRSEVISGEGSVLPPKMAPFISQSLTFAGGIEERGLEAGKRRVGQALVDGHLHGKAGVGVDVS